MEVRVHRLREALELLGPVVPRKPTLPVLAHVLLKEGRAVATDLDVAVAVELPEAEGACLLPYREAAELLKRIPGREVAAIEREGAKVHIAWEDGKATFATLDPEEYPPLPQLPDAIGEGTVDGDALVKALTSAAEYCATEESRPILTGVTLEFGEGIEVVAGDGFRMSYRTLPMGFAVPEGAPRKVVLPRKAVETLGHLWARAPKTLELDPAEAIFQLAISRRLLGLAFNGELLQARTGSATLLAKLIGGSPPNWRQLIPSEPPMRVRVMAGDLERAVRRLKEVADKTKGIVRLAWSGGVLRAWSEDGDGNRAEATVPVALEGEEGKIALSVGYLLDYLKGKEGMVEIGVTSPSQPIQFRQADKSAPLVVIMPMFVEW